MTTYYFVRVNGKTLHNNPSLPDSYVPGEPPVYPTKKFNYLEFCFKHDIVRIGWPDTGDLSANGANRLGKGYDYNTMKPYKRVYVQKFSQIPVGSVILVPDIDNSGDIYIATVTRAYWYHHDVPTEPYECAHRVGVEWDRDSHGNPRLYRAEQLNIRTVGFWRYAFQILNDVPTGRAAIPFIEAARRK